MLPPPLPPPAVYYFPPAAAYHLHGESEEWDMNAPTSAASVQSLAAASLQLLGKEGLGKDASLCPGAMEESLRVVPPTPRWQQEPPAQGSR